METRIESAVRTSRSSAHRDEVGRMAPLRGPILRVTRQPHQAVRALRQTPVEENRWMVVDAV